MKDLEISYCTHNELPSVKELWKNVFGDDEIFINQFFYHLYQDNILIGKVKNEIIAMATLLPATIILEGKEYDIRYVYACATLPRFRGKKIMSKILDKAFENTVNRREIGLFLLPANAQLYDFYKKNGFKEFFYHNEQHFFLSDFVEKKCDTYTMQKITAEKYYSLRHTYLQNEGTIHYPLSHFQFVDDAKINYPAQFYEILCAGKNVAIGFIEKNIDNILAREFLCKEFDMKILYVISQHFEHERITLYTPGKIYRDAMLRSEKNAFFEKGVVGYFNMALQ